MVIFKSEGTMKFSKSGCRLSERWRMKTYDENGKVTRALGVNGEQ